MGQDSVYYFDFMPDCESEGKILFKDRLKDRVGFLNKDGAVIIPAMYNYASPFHNGVAIARKNAIRKCWGGGDTTDCEHLGWDGGETVLINERNEEVIGNWDQREYNLDWYSMKVNDPFVDTTIYVTVIGKKGNRYSFIDCRKEFALWFDRVVIPKVNSEHKDSKEGVCFAEVT